ncbi:MAG: class I SAM-dependent methyltransferase [Bacteroidales bacterium]|nr:class I SAM-dependent methyltransferase [Bacteroidota bacterium]MBL6949373.1 class I SAM-dependent methyltransferase [Bacteroidales bacterium]
MNFGYSDKDQAILLNEQNEPDRYAIQLYHHLASATEVKNKDIVEIGCGRGGGLAFITQNFSPASAKGLDLDREAISFCNHNYTLDGLSFLHGDAQNLRLENHSCDVVINVESSHRYPNMTAFLREVSRILRSGGYFLFTDFRYDHEIEELKKELELSGMSVLTERFINQEVIAALELDDERKRKLVKKLVPKFLHKLALNFAGTIGSETYNQLVAHKYIYFSYVLQKRETN